MLKKVILLPCVLSFFLVLDNGKVNAESLVLQFVEPDVSKNMAKLRWDMPELKGWRKQPIETVNQGRDGVFKLKVKVVNVPSELINVTPRLKICPIPNSPQKCWEQEVLSPINSNGVFNCKVYFRLSNWDTHLLKFKLGSEVISISIKEEPFDGF